MVVRRAEKEKLKRFSERRDRSKSETAIALGMLLETHGGTVCLDENRSPVFKCMTKLIVSTHEWQL